MQRVGKVTLQLSKNDIDAQLEPNHLNLLSS